MGTRTKHTDLSTARKSAQVIRGMIADHQKLCRDCHQFRPNLARYCDTDYGLEQQLARTLDDIRRLTPADLGPAPTLF